jgi:hypothetical protein
MKKNKKKFKNTDKISRKDALKKMGMGAFTAGTMMFLLSNPAKAQDPSLPPDWEW